VEWFKVILDFISSLAWPITLIVFLVLFRTAIGKLLTRLTRAEVAGQKFDFGTELKAAEHSTEAAIDAARESNESTPPGAAADTSPPSSDGDREAPAREDREPGRASSGPSSEEVRSLLVSSQPTGLVMRSWISIESAVNSLHEKIFGDDRSKRPTTTQRQINELASYLPEDAVDSIQRMRKMRNEVAHGNAQVDLGEAIAYAETAATVVDLLGFIERSTPGG
jgi:hypothetical protein